MPFSVGDYQEFNEAMLEAEISTVSEVELVVEYGGFPQESRNMSEMQMAAQRLAMNISALKMQRLRRGL